MYKLKRVYATISFEASKISLLVVEYDKNNQMHCLYHNSIKQVYLTPDFTFINHELLINNLHTLINNADEFLGINIKRYIVNVSCLPIEQIKKVSPSFQVLQALTLDHMNNHVNKILNMNRNLDEYALRVCPTGWYLDNNFTKDFPEGSIGSEIKFEYTCLSTPRKLITQFIDLVNEVSIKPIAITCDSLCLSILTECNGLDTLVIDIKTKSTIVNLYSKDGEIKTITHLDGKGSEWYINELKEVLKIDKSMDILPTIEAIDTLSVLQQEVVLLHKHSAEFLAIKQATTKSISDALRLVSKRLFKVIEQVITNMKETHNITINKAFLNVNETLQYAFKEACPRYILTNLPIKLLNNDIIGLEDYAVNGMIASILYVHKMQIETQDYHTYSIDPFISQNAENYQVKQNIWIKLGIISTKWVAKIGE